MKEILVIKDEPAIRLGITWLLVLKGLHVFETAVRRVGLLLNGTLKLDLMLRDVYLPVFDGFDIQRQVRRNSTAAFILFVVLTSQTNEEIYRRSSELGASHFFSKPISFDKLLTVVKHQLKVVTS